MPLPFHLGLRNNSHRVTLLRISGRGEVLGTAYPETVDRRLRILDQWGIQAQSPRRTELHTIDLPLPSRTQSILSHQLDATHQSRLSGGPGPLAHSRRAQESGVKERLHLGTAAAFAMDVAATRCRPAGSPGPRGR